MLHSGCVLQAELLTAKQAHSNARIQCEDAKKKVQQATNELHQLQRSNGPYQDAMTFDDQAGALLDAISKNKQRFRKPVLGPLGACISLEASANKYACLSSWFSHALVASSCHRGLLFESSFETLETLRVPSVQSM